MKNTKFKALYGTFDQHMIPLKVADVTNIVRENFLCENKICIRSKTDVGKLFGDSHPHKRNFLQLQVAERKHNIIDDLYEHDILIDLHETEKHIKLVYYVYINRNSNWKLILSGQLMQLKSYGLLDETDVYIHITDTTNFFEDIISTVMDIIQDATISTSPVNHFEYDGIKLVYDLARINPDAIMIYFHTKGMSYNIQSRKAEELILLEGTFKNWRRKLQFFNNTKINKIGLFPAVEDPFAKQHSGASGGWIWFNFWYARANYIINQCIEPGITTNRYYYEGWLAGPHENQSMQHLDCQNLYPDSHLTYFTAKQACNELNRLSHHNN